MLEMGHNLFSVFVSLTSSYSAVVLFMSGPHTMHNVQQIPQSQWLHGSYGIGYWHKMIRLWRKLLNPNVYYNLTAANIS